jgi:hypothetical protein
LFEGSVLEGCGEATLEGPSFRGSSPPDNAWQASAAIARIVIANIILKLLFI